jgi:hypothetical protein
MGKINQNYNYTAAFVEYSKGTAIEEIAEALAIPVDVLRRKASLERWQTLSGRVQMPSLLGRGKTERDLAKIDANRARNFEIAQKLQEDLLEIVGKLRQGTLTFEHRTAKGEIVVLPPNLRDRRDLASYAAEVANMSYRALGDVVAPAQPEGGPVVQGAGQITIVLPAPVAQPRQERSYDVESEVVSIKKPAFIDVQEVGVATTTAASPAETSN